MFLKCENAEFYNHSRCWVLHACAFYQNVSLWLAAAVFVCPSQLRLHSPLQQAETSHSVMPVPAMAEPVVDHQKRFQAAVDVIHNLPKNGM